MAKPLLFGCLEKQFVDEVLVVTKPLQHGLYLGDVGVANLGEPLDQLIMDVAGIWVQQSIDGAPWIDSDRMCGSARFAHFIQTPNHLHSQRERITYTYIRMATRIKK